MHSKFIAKEYIKHSNWSVLERLIITDYCYTALCVAKIFRSKVKDFQELLPLLHFFRGHVYKCSHLEYKMSYVIGVKIKCYYETESSGGTKTESSRGNKNKMVQGNKNKKQMLRIRMHELVMVRLKEVK